MITTLGRENLSKSETVTVAAIEAVARGVTDGLGRVGRAWPDLAHDQGAASKKPAA